MAYSCQKVLTLICRGLLGHIGSLLLIIMYLIGGGFLFIYLEGSNELEACKTSMNIYYQKLNDSAQRFVTLAGSGLNASLLSDQFMTQLMNFSTDVYSLSVSPSMDCTTLGTAGNLQKWNIANSIFFCATLVTTIGYGHIYPVTQWGRIVCIVYSFIGIPLMLIFLSNFGVLLANLFRFIYSNFCCCRCFIPLQKEPEVEITEEFMKSSSNFATLGHDDNHQMNSVAPQKIIEINNGDAEMEEEPIVTVPIIVVTLFIIFYMYIGTVLFQQWETWDLVAGMYFAFITISTIGLGDLYPTQGRQLTADTTPELLAAAVYCFIGLAVLSMCLNLISEEVAGKFQWLGEKIGLTKHEILEEEPVNESEYFEEFTQPITVKGSLMVTTDHENDTYEYEDMREGDDTHKIYPKIEYND